MGDCDNESDLEYLEQRSPCMISGYKRYQSVPATTLFEEVEDITEKSPNSLNCDHPSSQILFSERPMENDDELERSYVSIGYDNFSDLSSCYTPPSPIIC